MSDRQEFANGNAIDLAVSNQYRAGATEKVPGHLDRMILAEARREAARKNLAAGLPSWLVPAAFATVLALALSFNLEFNQTDLNPAVPDRSAAEESGTAVKTVDSTNDLEAAVESTGARLRALDDAVSTLSPGNKPASVPTSVPESSRESSRESSTESSAVGATGQSLAIVADAASADSSCSAEATASAETWRSCIQALQRSGQADAARVELELLEATFPESVLAH